MAPPGRQRPVPSETAQQPAVPPGDLLGAQRGLAPGSGVARQVAHEAAQAGRLADDARLHGRSRLPASVRAVARPGGCRGVALHGLHADRSLFSHRPRKPVKAGHTRRAALRGAARYRAPHAAHDYGDNGRPKYNIPRGDHHRRHGRRVCARLRLSHSRQRRGDEPDRRHCCRSRRSPGLGCGHLGPAVRAASPAQPARGSGTVGPLQRHDHATINPHGRRRPAPAGGGDAGESVSGLTDPAGLRLSSSSLTRLPAAPVGARQRLQGSLVCAEKQTRQPAVAR